jgi:hypothetical protein
MDVQDTSRASEALIPATKIDGANTVLPQHRSAHDTGLDSDIKVCLVENLDRMLGQDTSNGHEFGVPGAVQSSVRLIHAATNNLAVFDKDTANRCFVALQGKLSLTG